MHIRFYARRTTSFVSLAALIGVLGLAGCAATYDNKVGITPALANIQWLPANVVLGGTATIFATTPLSTAELNATADAPGTYVYSPAEGALLSPGTQTLSVTFTPSDTTHYKVTKSSVSINVVPFVAPVPKRVQIVAGGFITGVLFHPAQKNLRYARTDVGGAYRWDQAIGEWTPLLDFLSRPDANNTGVESIGIDPSDPQRLYLSTGLYAGNSYNPNGAFFLSDDQGRTFTQVAAPFQMGSNDPGRHAGERFAVDPNLGTTMYYGSRHAGLWKSIDRGLTWNQVTSFPVTGSTSGTGVVFITYVTGSGVSGAATPVLYAGVSDTGTSSTGFSSLYRSVDSGTTWQVVPGQPDGFYPAHGVLGADGITGSLGSLYITYGNQVGPDGITSGAIYQYTPTINNPIGPGTWTNITPTDPLVVGKTSEGGFGGITIDPQRPGVVMASTMDQYLGTGDDIFRSTDYGRTWVSLQFELQAQHDSSLSPWLQFGRGMAGAATGNWPGSMAIDPFDSNHFIYGTGQTLWDTGSISQADSIAPVPPATTPTLGFGPTFTVGGFGIEETVVLGLASPTFGANLVSAVGDLGGFVHTSFTSSPAKGAIPVSNGATPGRPALSTGTSVDFAQSNANKIVIVGNGGVDDNHNPQDGYYTIDGGANGNDWSVLALPPGSKAGSGTVAFSPDATTLLWAASDAPPAVTVDFGKTWTASANAIQGAQVVADRVNPKKFYIYDSQTGTLQISVDGGLTFTTQSSLPAYSYGQLTASPGGEGDLWLAVNGASSASVNGLYHTTDSGKTLTLVPSLTAAYAVGLGAPATSTAFAADASPAVYTAAVGASGYGFYRSIDGGATWLLISDANHLLGYVGVIIGDPRIFGRFYIGTGGRGILYGDTQ